MRCSASGFFSQISFPSGPEYQIGAISNVNENSRFYSKVKVNNQCQRHWPLAIKGQIFEIEIFPILCLDAIELQYTFKK
jgi:hypothetical protein